MDNLNVQVQNDGYVYISPVSGSFTWVGPTVYTVLGQGMVQMSQTGQTIYSGTWYQLPIGYSMANIGDMVVSTIGILDTGKVYRVTALKSSNSPLDVGIAIERLI